MDSFSAMSDKCLKMSLGVILIKSNFWHILCIVFKTLSGFVVARINTTLAGGSSIVFNKAFEAAVESIWHSSITYTFHLACVGANLALSIISRIFSTPVFDAASISIISSAFPSVICLHKSHLQQGVIVGWSNAWQFRDFANILALDVFPVPLGPLKRYAGAIFLLIELV